MENLGFAVGVLLGLDVAATDTTTAASHSSNSICVHMQSLFSS